MIKETARIVSAYVSGNRLSETQLPDFIRSTYSALLATAALDAAPTASRNRTLPAVAVKKSVTAAAITCLDCGRKFSMLKRHLRTDHHSSVEEYRHRWSLPASYPMVAADYAARRSALAVKVGLGRKQVLSLTQPPLHGRASKGN